MVSLLISLNKFQIQRKSARYIFDEFIVLLIGVRGKVNLVFDYNDLLRK